MLVLLFSSDYDYSTSYNRYICVHIHIVAYSCIMSSISTYSSDPACCCCFWCYHYCWCCFRRIFVLCFIFIVYLYMCVYQAFKYSISWVIFNSFQLLFAYPKNSLNNSRWVNDGVKIRVGLYSQYNPTSFLDIHQLLWSFLDKIFKINYGSKISHISYNAIGFEHHIIYQVGPLASPMTPTPST